MDSNDNSEDSKSSNEDKESSKDVSSDQDTSSNVPNNDSSMKKLPFGNMIADIFGEMDDSEDDEFEGFQKKDQKDDENEEEKSKSDKDESDIDSDKDKGDSREEDKEDSDECRRESFDEYDKDDDDEVERDKDEEKEDDDDDDAGKDSYDDDEGKTSKKKRKRIITSDSEDEKDERNERDVSDYEKSVSDSQENNTERSIKRKKRIEDSDQEDENDEKSSDEDKEDKLSDLEKNDGKESDQEDDDRKASDQERENNEEKQINEEDIQLPELSSDDEETVRRPKHSEDFVYDFDIMMQRKKEESYRRRKRKNIDIINDSDDIIAELITQMKQAAEDDFEYNKNRRAATRKLKLLPMVETQLRKIDLREAFLDAGVLGVITDWLTPLPDRSLPNLHVRETMLKLLTEFNIMDVERLKASGIGKAVMYLFKHPKETKENKKRAGYLISNWSRPIFSLDSDFHTMSKEEREQRDFDHMTKATENKRNRNDSISDGDTPGSSKSKSNEDKLLRPGDKGWIPRARVPMPSTKDYVIRPKSNVDSEMGKSGSKKAITRLDRHMRNFREKKKLMKTQRAVPISIEGRKMSL